MNRILFGIGLILLGIAFVKESYTEIPKVQKQNQLNQNGDIEFIYMGADTLRVFDYEI